VSVIDESDPQVADLSPSKRSVVLHSRSLKIAYHSPDAVYVATRAAFNDPVRVALTRRQPLPGLRRDARFNVGGNWMRFFILASRTEVYRVPERG
jgi:hypothetical protein